MGDLRRFVEAQAPVYATALAELKAGHKQSHWMWFVFPQLKALGRSSMAQFYGLHDLIEAHSYWSHPVLGPRLKECVLAVLEVPSKTAHEIFGSPDDLKFCSCLTLFEQVSPDECFGVALERFYGGRRDEKTMALSEDRPTR
ncbi:calpastatin [Rhizobacter sp. Root404]|nr:DUF1810 domain-containing protein [Rhizobacter sp. Root404]KQW36846.1 calpastatin [Rhizobacter sp. Root404]